MVLETLSGAKPPEERGASRPIHDGVGGDGDGDNGVLDEEQEGDGGRHEDEGEAARFCTAWLLCVGSGTIGCLLAKVGGRGK